MTLVDDNVVKHVSDDVSKVRRAFGGFRVVAAVIGSHGSDGDGLSLPRTAPGIAQDLGPCVTEDAPRPDFLVVVVVVRVLVGRTGNPGVLDGGLFVLVDRRTLLFALRLKGLLGRVSGLFTESLRAPLHP